MNGKMEDSMFDLTPDEQEIEDAIDTFIPVPDEGKKRIEAILDRARKNRSISLRISEFDLVLIKEKAADYGMPYQTLINSVLHKYVTDQLYEKDEVIKTIRLMHKV